MLYQFDVRWINKIQQRWFLSMLDISIINFKGSIVGNMHYFRVDLYFLIAEVE